MHDFRVTILPAFHNFAACLPTTSSCTPFAAQVDKETNQPIRDGPAVLKWERSLRTMCAKMGAKFVSYKADGGVWKFEVGCVGVYRSACT